jgi:hypothetical protein
LFPSYLKIQNSLTHSTNLGIEEIIASKNRFKQLLKYQYDPLKLKGFYTSYNNGLNLTPYLLFFLSVCFLARWLADFLYRHTSNIATISYHNSRFYYSSLVGRPVTHVFAVSPLTSLTLVWQMAEARLS